MSDTKRNECLGELNAPTQAMLNAIRNNYVASGARQNMLTCLLYTSSLIHRM